jgi:hypothetical protein
MPRVYNKRNGHPTGAIYVGRGSPFGNPFSHQPHAAVDVDHLVESRAVSIERFEQWLGEPEQLALVVRIRRQLRGRDLVCWCHPEACHAEVIMRIANE